MKKLVRFLSAPLMILCLVTGWLLIKFFEYIDEPYPDDKMSDEIKQDIVHFSYWLIFKNRP